MDQTTWRDRATRNRRDGTGWLLQADAVLLGIHTEVGNRFVGVIEVSLRRNGQGRLGCAVVEKGRLLFGRNFDIARYL